MRRTLFLSIMHKLSETSSYFYEMYDTTGRVGLTTLQKCTATLCQLAYGMAVNTIDEYLKLLKNAAL
jgi:NADH:ubiquinone oxidoreductase subunit E